MPVIYSLTRPVTTSAAREFRAAFGPVMDRVRLPVDERDKFLLAMSEVVTNLVRHPNPKPRHIRVLFERKRADWQLSVCDDGPAFRELEEKSKSISNSDTVLGEGGMGIYLVTQNFPKWQYCSRDEMDGQWNSFVISVPSGDEAAKLPKIVLVDDDPSMRAIVATFLTGRAEVKDFESAHDAMAYLIGNGADLIISDIRMPDVDGLEFRRQLEASGESGAIPFIFLTGSNEQNDLSAAVDLSIDDYVSKPVTREKILSVVARVLNRSRDIKARLGDRLDSEITGALSPRINRGIKGFNVSVSHEAASAGGGDLLVERAVEGGHVLVLADIMGHGEQAKFFAHALSGYVYGAIRGFAANLPPAEMLAELNDLFRLDSLMSQSIATAMVVFVRPGGDCSIASAGHPPPLLRATGKVRELDVGGPLLGLLEDPSYEQIDISLKTGEHLILYTDGIMEADRSAECIPTDMLIGLPFTLDTASVEMLSNGLLSDAQSKSGFLLGDDATVVVLQKN